MKAITVEPHKPGSARLEDVPEPDPRNGAVLVEAIAVGVCGTDVEIATGKYGWAPPGKTRLVLGHESLGRVLEPDPSGRFKKVRIQLRLGRAATPVPSRGAYSWRDIAQAPPEKASQQPFRTKLLSHLLALARWIEPMFAVFASIRSITPSSPSYMDFNKSSGVVRLTTYRAHDCLRLGYRE
jgi:hypothetical protein